MKKVLVTAIGTITATSIVRELKKTGQFYIIGADINQRNEIATSLDVDEYHTFPYSVNEDYIPFALKFCKNHQVGYYYAVIDREVVNVSKNRSAFEAVGTKVCVANYEFARICHFKNLFSSWINEHIPDIAIREYTDLAEAKDADYPLFIKPSEGVASTGCKRIESYQELALAVEDKAIGQNILIQDFVEGKNITVDCIRNRQSAQIFQIQRRELLRNSNGCGIAVEIFNNPELTEICNKLMIGLDLNGVVNMEFFETERGYKIIEINPRFSAGTTYSCMAGINTVLNAMRIADGQECISGEIAIGAHFAERYEAYRMD